MKQLFIRYIFDDSESRTEGLQHKQLNKDECALFLFEAPRYPKFWMKGVNYNLYLSAIADSECVDMDYMHARTSTPHALSKKVELVVESRVEIPLGSKVDIVGDMLAIR